MSHSNQDPSDLTTGDRQLSNEGIHQPPKTWRQSLRWLGPGLTWMLEVQVSYSFHHGWVRSTDMPYLYLRRTL